MAEGQWSEETTTEAREVNYPAIHRLFYDGICRLGHSAKGSEERERQRQCESEGRRGRVGKGQRESV